MKSVLECLVGVKVHDGRVESRPGVLGLVRAYFGAVEAQGHGNLHCHLLLWLANTPDTVEINCHMRDPLFRERLRTYIARTVTADVDGFLPENANQHYDHPHPSFCRPPDPRSPSFHEDCLKHELVHIQTSQYHECRHNKPLSSPCLIRKKGGQFVVCKDGVAL
jgi:hypothetical protein